MIAAQKVDAVNLREGLREVQRQILNGTTRSSLSHNLLQFSKSITGGDESRNQSLRYLSTVLAYSSKTMTSGVHRESSLEKVSDQVEKARSIYVMRRVVMEERNLSHFYAFHSIFVHGHRMSWFKCSRGAQHKAFLPLIRDSLGGRGKRGVS